MQLSQDNGFLVFCASLAGVFLMIGSMCLQYGLAYAGVAICLPYQIAVSISVGEPPALSLLAVISGPGILQSCHSAPKPSSWHA